MELNHEKLQTLIVRAWDLHDRLNNEIDKSISFCRHCSDQGRFCDIGQTPFEERKRLIAIRDSLKDVENTLLHFKKLQAWQLRDKHSLLCRLEQSRFFLAKQVTQYEGRPLDVVKELNACFAPIESDVEGTVKKNEGRSTRRGLSGFLFCWLRVIFNPWKWQNVVGIAVKLVLVSASLSYTIQFYHSKQQSRRNSRRKLIVSAMYSKEKLDSILTISNMPLDVSCGRG
ncbi:uncharacterized protein LOC120119807 [Hibiscus syriacus]|uniref:uncharacterized protein LOC120119807 n=1 Tax=Hibiscus syriacus TaxID=106335 RepID=UPI00192084FC|nr:uncharacterized protein LOC120119807 [Hibiscus syriacus]